MRKLIHNYSVSAGLLANPREEPPSQWEREHGKIETPAFNAGQQANLNLTMLSNRAQITI